MPLSARVLAIKSCLRKKSRALSLKISDSHAAVVAVVVVAVMIEQTLNVKIFAKRVHKKITRL